MFGETQSPMAASPASSMYGYSQSTVPQSSMYGHQQYAMPAQAAMAGAMAPLPPLTPTSSMMTSGMASPASSTLSSQVGSLTSSFEHMSVSDINATSSKKIHPQQFENVVTSSGAAAMAASAAMGRGAHRGRRDDLVVATRPKHMTDKTGMTGMATKLVANYFRLESLPQMCVNQYHVDFLPLVESSRIRRALINDHREQFGRCFVFDGMSDLKTPKRMPQTITELFSKRRTDGAAITIKIKWVQELAPTNPDLLRLFNTQMRRNLEHLDFVQINRHFFDKSAVSAIPQHGLELWQGLITAIGQYETAVMMVTDTVHKVLRRDSVLDLLSQVTSGPYYREEAMKRVAGCIVMTPYNNKTYRIDDIDWNKSPLSIFETKEGPKTYIQYYEDQYEKRIRDAKQPLLVCRPKEKDIRAGRTDNIYLVPELCVLTGLTDEMRANVSVMRDLAQHTRIDPPKRVQNLLQFIKRINGNDAIRAEMEQWGLTFSDSLVSIDARTLYPEKVMQGQQVYKCDPKTADFSRDMRDKRLHVAVAIETWLVMCHKRDDANVTEFVRTLMSVCPPMGLHMGHPKVLKLEDDRAANYVRALHEVGGSGDLQLALIVVPNNRKDRYDMIKKQACVDLGIHTQVILSRTIGNRKNIRSVATKVAIQLNCKLGGEAWCLEIPLANTMVIGYDTYHDAGSRNRSAGAFVASMNRTFTRWYSRVSFHASHQELGSSLAQHLKDSLCKYSQENNGTSPERIIFFRDGVSDGQIPQVKEWEIEQIVDSLEGLFPGMEQKLAFVVVTKRISTRFFAHTSDGSFCNPLPGTVIDREVTRPERYDFFLVSQSVRQGTVSPTHYNIIHDTTGLRPDHMQRLAYKLTHLYFNWPGTIRVPAPCQYAHKLAFLAGQSLHGEHCSRLNGTLFYL